MLSLCNCGRYVIGTPGHTWDAFVVQLRSVHHRDIWPYIGATCGESRQWGNSLLFRIITIRKIVFGNFRSLQEWCGYGVAYVLCTLGCLTRLNWGCGNFNELWSQMWWSQINFQSQMGIHVKWSRKWMWLS